MDRDGNYAIPMEDCNSLYSADDGHFLRVEIADPLASPSRSRWFLLLSLIHILKRRMFHVKHYNVIPVQAAADSGSPAAAQ